MSFVTRPTICYANKTEPGWRNFAPHPDVVRMYDSKAPVHELEVAEGVDEPDSYWAWWDAEDEKFTMIYYARMIVEMCFTYGSKPEEDRGRGKLLPVVVTDRGLAPAKTSRSSE